MRRAFVLPLVLVGLSCGDGEGQSRVFVSATPSTAITMPVGQVADLELTAELSLSNRDKSEDLVSDQTRILVRLQPDGALADVTIADVTEADSFEADSETRGGDIRIDERDANGFASASLRVRCAVEGTDQIRLVASVNIGETSSLDSEPVTIDVTCTGAAPVTCGGSTCAGGEYCDYPANTCADEPGSMGFCSSGGAGDCTIANDGPACGCDGQVYQSSLCAFQAGTDLSFAGGCTPPNGTFACGSTFCDTATGWCSLREAPVSFCEVLPAACTAGGATPTCDCLPVKCAPGFVEVSCDDTGGEITVVCEMMP